MLIEYMYFSQLNQYDLRTYRKILSEFTGYGGVVYNEGEVKRVGECNDTTDVGQRRLPRVKHGLVLIVNKRPAGKAEMKWNEMLVLGHFCT